jgi:prepilin-type processing-associated H-X9-DG protein
VRLRLLLLVSGLIVPGLVCPTGFAAKLSEIAFEEMLPEDTIFFLSVPDASQLVAHFKESNCYKILDEIDPLGLMKGQREFEQAKQFYNMFIEPLTKVFHGKIGLAIKNIPPGPGIPGVIFLADVGDKEEALRNYLKERIEPLAGQVGAQGQTFTHGEYEVRQMSLAKPVPLAVCYTVADKVFIATVGTETMEQVLDLAARPRSLAENDLYKEVRHKIGEKSDFLVYANTAALLESLRPIIPEEVRVILEVTGLTGVKGIGLGAEPLGSASKGTWYMAAGPERKGFLGLIARKAPPLKVAGYLPEDVTFMYALSLGDLNVFWDELTEALRQTIVSLKGERAWGQFVNGLRRVEEKTGFRIKEDLLSPFGGEICIAVKVPEVLGFPPIFLLVESKDADKASVLLDNLIAAVEKAVGAPAARTTQEYKGVKITSVSVVPRGGGTAASFAALPFMRPAFAIVDDFLVVGVHANQVKKIVDVRRGGKSLEDDPDFQRVFSHLSPQGSVTSYLNLKDLYDFLYGTFGGIAATQIGPEMVGKLGRISKYFGSAGGRLSCDEKGIKSENYSDSGGAEQILPYMAMMTVLPAITRARHTAEQAVCVANLRQLSLACTMYANDHDDILPARLSQLYPDYVPDLSTFVSPVHRKATGLIRAEDIDTGSDYELKTPGAKLGEIKEPARTVMLLEKAPPKHGGRPHAAYVDGHVAQVEPVVEGLVPAPK